MNIIKILILICILFIFSACGTAMSEKQHDIITIRQDIIEAKYDDIVKKLENVINTEDSTLILETAYIYLAYYYDSLGENLKSKALLDEAYKKTFGEHILKIKSMKIPLDINNIIVQQSDKVLNFEYSENSKTYLKAQQFPDKKQKYTYYNDENIDRVVDYNGENTWITQKYNKTQNSFTKIMETSLENNKFKTKHYKNGIVDYITHRWFKKDGTSSTAKFTPDGIIIDEKEISPDEKKIVYKNYDKIGKLEEIKVERVLNEKTVIETYNSSEKLETKLEITKTGDSEEQFLYDGENNPISFTVFKAGKMQTKDIYFDKEDGSGVQTRYTFADTFLKTEKFTEKGELSTYTLEYRQGDKAFIEYREADGKLASTNIVETKQDGSWTDISKASDGKIQREHIGSPDGSRTEKYYYDDGKLQEIGEYSPEGHSIKKFYSTGNLSYTEVFNIAENKRDIKEFDKNGILEQQRILQTDETRFISYRRDGTKKREEINSSNGSQEERYYSSFGDLVYVSVGNISERKISYYTNGFVQKYMEVVYDIARDRAEYRYYDQNKTRIDEKIFNKIVSEYEILLKSDEN